MLGVKIRKSSCSFPETGYNQPCSVDVAGTCMSKTVLDKYFYNILQLIFGSPQKHLNCSTNLCPLNHFQDKAAPKYPWRYAHAILAQDLHDIQFMLCELQKYVHQGQSLRDYAGPPCGWVFTSH